MYKVLIIDDESIIRKGIKNIVNWKQLDCEVCADASDGIEGIELIKKYLPEIIITDIRMPGMDGLSMIKQVKGIVPYSKIIILTGYRDFDYVQEAIKFGAFDFLLKPSKIEELTAVLTRAVNEINDQKVRHMEIDRFKVLFEQSIPVLREKLLYDIIYGLNTNEYEITEKMKLFNISIKNFVLVVMENDYDEKSNSSQYDKHLYQFGIVNSFEEIFAEKYEVLSIMLNSSRVGFIIQKPDRIPLDIEEVSEKCSYLQEVINNGFGFTVTIAVSSGGISAMELPEKLKECLGSLEYKSYMGTNSIIQYSDLNSFFRYEDYSTLDKYQKQLLESIKAGNEGLVKVTTQNIARYVTTNKININYMKNFYYTTLSSINNIRISVSAIEVDKRHEEGRDIASLLKLIEKSESAEELNSLLEDVAVRIAEKVNNFNNKSIKLILRKAIDYIQEHYSEQVTLNEVAENIYVSTFYISRMFKKELGKSFVDYLNDVRIEKSKELLKDIKYKTYEVAEIVGISDPHYFSKLFKKYSGMTPSEYRETQVIQ
ncbi:response regulator transcription factor [Ruminiclostridium cellobioparum]|uniref:Stage 0 sporulation protein A homolog n=1 Tax=Ruminiclostridium cellobioparum subsp. termitidis CT1112 TaxID=1195236 RepID=S0FFG6_RUMCE|nr:response regulator [Ruminiclostridium cellobioparum]EMS69655.1 two component transcriptional regulator, AraC family protein [Ruminiclostridium cellobioparum subsp. termitidis CT1112]